ncbi:glycosyltransferase family 2 protein [Parasediminibacterium sp. JCM 36343]|uniref:glycosyltransferase family 2 protein n=1 Tax=Parasediminibacterium sp. JCM 36343 TaxID=3374279 RepID=UPI00397BC281
MKVSIIIINYNTFQLTCSCIESIIKHTKSVDYEIVLVDNASTECSPVLFAEKYTQIILVPNNKNGGFAQGNNTGIEKATGELLLLLNSDTYLIEDSISIAANAFKAKQNIGALGVRMVFPDTNKVQYTARRFRGISWEWLDLLRFILYLMPYTKRARLMFGKYFKLDFSTYCDWVNGAFFMFEKRLLLKLPNEQLDNRFFMYGEDHLWCYQFTKLGYPSYFLHTTTIVHINNGSTIKSKQLRLMLTMIKNELAIMQERKGKGLYYYLFCMVYLSKEYSRYFIKYIISKNRS